MEKLQSTGNINVGEVNIHGDAQALGPNLKSEVYHV